MSNLLFDTLFAPHAGNDAPFLIISDQAPWTFAEFLAVSARYARLFEAMGVVKGDRIALQVAKSPESLAVYAACARTGAVLLPLNIGYTVAEIDYFVGDAEPRLFICDPPAADGLAAVAARHGAAVLTLGADGGGSLGARSAGLASAQGVVACGPDDLAALLYTSGTTGRSKGAMLTHANLVSNAQTLARTWHFSSSDVLLHALPIFHTHGLFVAVNTCLAAGARIIFQPGFNPLAVFDAMPQATVMMGVPTFYTRLLADPRLDRQAVAHMRLFVSGSAPLLAETHERFEHRTGHRILERYGMTETNMNSSNPYDGERRAGTVGQPLLDVEIRITDAVDGTLSPVGEIGMIEVRGPNVFAGYWRMPEKTMAELRPDGWFITGDLGQFAADGYLSIVGRQKDLIISAGYNIYPKEIELLIDEQEGVVESAVFGIAHTDLGEAVAAAVVVDPAAGLDAEAILAGLRDRIARFKQPRLIKVVEALPRNAMGKVQKNLLREQFSS